MIEIFFAVILGIILGIITGITPGLHVNTVGILIFSISDSILKKVTPLTLCSFFVSIALCHAMIEFIPSLLVGLPNEDTILSIQPGHRLLFKGEEKGNTSSEFRWFVINNHVNINYAPTLHCTSNNIQFIKKLYRIPIAFYHDYYFIIF